MIRLELTKANNPGRRFYYMADVLQIEVEQFRNSYTHRILANAKPCLSNISSVI